MVSIAPFSTHLPSPHPPIQKTAVFCMFSFFYFFHPFFQGGQLTPFAPMCGRPCLGVLLVWLCQLRVPHPRVRYRSARRDVRPVDAGFHLAGVHRASRRSVGRSVGGQEFIQILYYSNLSSRFFLYTACSANFRHALARLVCRRRRGRLCARCS